MNGLLAFEWVFTHLLGWSVPPWQAERLQSGLRDWLYLASKLRKLASASDMTDKLCFTDICQKVDRVLSHWGCFMTTSCMSGCAQTWTETVKRHDGYCTDGVSVPLSKTSWWEADRPIPALAILECLAPADVNKWNTTQSAKMIPYRVPTES